MIETKLNPKTDIDQKPTVSKTVTMEGLLLWVERMIHAWENIRENDREKGWPTDQSDFNIHALNLVLKEAGRPHVCDCFMCVRIEPDALAG
jgi:hypothetical protein